MLELEKDICSQTYPDGVGHEGSIPYHRLVTEMFLHAGLLCIKNDIHLSKNYWQQLEKMLDFATAYIKPNGLAPIFGDNDNGPSSWYCHAGEKASLTGELNKLVVKFLAITVIIGLFFFFIFTIKCKIDISERYESHL